MCMYIHICIYVYCIYTYVHIHTCVYIYIYTYTYIYIYREREGERKPPSLEFWEIPSWVGWHYLSHGTCLIRPHVFSAALLV